MKQYKLLIGFVFLGMLQMVHAQKESYYLRTPADALHMHFDHLKPDDYDLKLARIPFLKNGRLHPNGEELAVQLKAVFDAGYVFLDPADWPHKSNYVDSLSMKKRYVLHQKYPTIFLVQNKTGNWIYSQKTIDSIPKLFKSAYPFFLSKLFMKFEKTGDPVFVGLYLWQVIGLVVFFTASFLLFWVFRLVFRIFVPKALQRFGVRQSERHDFIKSIGIRTSLACSFYFLVLIFPVLGLPQTAFFQFLTVMIRLIPLFFIMLVALKICDETGVVLKRAASKTDTKMDDQLAPIIPKLLKVVVFVIVFFYALILFGVEIMPLLAGLSLGGLAVALAAQDTLKNLFGGLMIFLDKPFQIGDIIRTTNIEGTVESVGFRASLIRSYQNSLQYVPNSLLSDSAVDNLGRRQQRRFRTMISVTYDTPPHKIEVFVQGVRQIIDNYKTTNKDTYQVYLHNLGAASLDIILNVHFMVPSWDEELEGRHDLIKSVLELAEVLEVRMAFPTQTLHIEELPGKPSLTPAHEVEKDRLIEKMKQYTKKQ